MKRPVSFMSVDNHASIVDSMAALAQRHPGELTYLGGVTDLAELDRTMPAPDVVVEPVLSESPTTDTALPLTVTGISTETTAWLPPRMLPTPVVSSACAWAERTIPPPTTRAIWSPRRMDACMVFPFRT